MIHPPKQKAEKRETYLIRIYIAKGEFLPLCCKTSLLSSSNDIKAMAAMEIQRMSNRPKEQLRIWSITNNQISTIL